MEKLRIREVLVVEGRYDAAKLTDLVEGLIITTGGFSIFSDPEKRELLKKLGKERGLLVLTDSDAAGFRIRRYINQFAAGAVIKNVYIPAVKGKESRKTAPSKEGLLGVEGMPANLLYQALQEAGATQMPKKEGRAITYTDLYELGLSGTQGSADKRRALLARVGLPARLSKKALLQVLNSLYSYEELCALAQPKPMLFWDFHGTLTTEDIIWFTAAQQALQHYLPEASVSRETIEKSFGQNCLPWRYFANGDTRSVVGSKAWWSFCELRFTEMFQRCGLTEEQAAMLAPHIREFVLVPDGFFLFPDVVKVLRTLQKRGYRQAVLSNNFPELSQVVQGLGLAPYLETVISSGCVGYEKPRSEFFAYAREKTGADICVMLGDNVPDDICGAKQTGFYAVAVHKTQQVSQADLTVNHLSELLDYFT